MRKLTKLMAVSALAITAALGATTQQAAAKPDQLTIYGGPLNTSWYVMAGWLATELQKAGVKSSSELGGALSNLVQISQGPANMGITFAAATPAAYAGQKPFAGPVTDFCALQLLQRSAFHALVSASSGVESVMDLKGKTFGGQAVGNLSQLALADLLAVNGLSDSDLTLAVGGQQFGADGVKDRRFAGFAAMTGYPSPPMMDAATSVPVKFLNVDDAAFEKVKARNPGYVRTEVPAGTYPGQDMPINTFGTFSVLLMNPNSSEADQTFVTKLVHDNWAGLNAAHSSTKWLTPKIAAAIPGVPLCPGAKAYWTSVGAL